MHFVSGGFSSLNEHRDVRSGNVYTKLMLVGGGGGPQESGEKPSLTIGYTLPAR